MDNAANSADNSRNNSTGRENYFCTQNDGVVIELGYSFNMCVLLTAVTT